MLGTPPIGIRSIRIENFRGIDELRLEFTGPGGGVSDIAVIAGPNGCGKTSVLEACLLALAYDGELQGAKGPDAARAGAREWLVEADITTPHGSYRIQVRNGRAKWFNATSAIEQQPAVIACLYFSSWRSPRLVGALPITAGRPGKRPRDTEQNRVWRAKQYFIDSKAHALMAQSGLFSGEEFESDFAQLNEIWRLFHPGMSVQFVIEPVSRDPSAGFDVILTDSSGRKVAVDALSSGQLELFAFFGSLLRLKFGEGIVVIDEPELHLDPQWHALMLRAFRRFLPRAQLLVATHSPQVFDAVLSFQRHFLVPKDDPRAIAWGVGTPQAGVAAP